MDPTFISPPSKRQKDFQAKHRSLYKTPPNWLQSYRSKCISALSARRQERASRLVDGLRKINLTSADLNDQESKDDIIRQIMASVWKECNFTVDYEACWTDYENDMKELKMDLLKDDQGDYFDYLWENLQQDEFDWTVENQYSVSCFACEKSSLSLYTMAINTQVVCHQCQFNILVNFPFTAEQLHNRVNQLLDQHGLNCSLRLHFELITYPLSNVKFECTSCHFSEMLFS